MQLKDNSPIPLFNRIRTVSINGNNMLRCTCKSFERTGLPCVHIYTTIKTIDPEWEGFVHHDVSIRWWTSYLYNGFCDDSDLSKLYENAIANDIDGPKLRSSSINNLTNIPTVAPSSTLGVWERIHNYSPSEVKKLKKKLQRKKIQPNEPIITEYDGYSTETYYSTQDSIPESKDDKDSYAASFADDDSTFNELRLESFDRDISDVSSMQGDCRALFIAQWNNIMDAHNAYKCPLMRRKLSDFMKEHLIEMRKLTPIRETSHQQKKRKARTELGIVGMKKSKY